MRRAGKLRFTLQGQTHTLTAFVSADDAARQRLFVPFRDPTAGAETYASGRYLDLDRTPTALYDLDYIRNNGPLRDLSILLQTIYVVITGWGAR